MVLQRYVSCGFAWRQESSFWKRLVNFRCFCSVFVVFWIIKAGYELSRGWKQVLHCSFSSVFSSARRWAASCASVLELQLQFACSLCQLTLVRLLLVIDLPRSLGAASLSSLRFGRCLFLRSRYR